MRAASFTVIHGCFVETIGAVEGTDTSNHDIRTLIITSSVVKYFALRTGSTSGVASQTFLAVVGTILASAVNGISSNWANIKTLKVEEISAARSAAGTFAWMFSTGLARSIAFNA